MKKYILMFGLAISMAVAVPVSGDEPRLVDDINDEGKTGEQAAVEETPRHKRIMRELDREYQSGSLTRTEYIQRKRELADLEE